MPFRMSNLFQMLMYGLDYEKRMKFRIQLATYGRLIKQLLLKKQIINLDENLGGCCSREMQSLRYLHDLQTSDLDPISSKFAENHPKHSKKKKKKKNTT